MRSRIRDAPILLWCERLWQTPMQEERIILHGTLAALLLIGSVTVLMAMQ